jgi:hypothetical protein
MKTCKCNSCLNCLLKLKQQLVLAEKITKQILEEYRKRGN